MTWDERLHYIGGYFKALPARPRSRGAHIARCRVIDAWAWDREVAQHDPDLTPHQIAEARAWGRGARAAVNLRGLPWLAPYPPEV